jgi:acetylornithine deacetylase/succinyl-diaminopimelate desuccinylase-like protein
MDLGGRAMLGATVAPSFFNFLDAPTGFPEDVLESSRVKKIHQYIKKHKAEHIEKIQTDLRQPSVSSWNLGINEMADVMKESFTQLGCKESQFVKTDGYPGVWAWYDADAKKTISHYMMYDTQPFDESEWSSPPLAANLVKMDPFPQVIIARGAVNDKGPNRAFLNACEAIIAVEGKLPVNIMFTCDGEEEQGSPHFHQVLEPYHERLKKCEAHLGVSPSQNREGFVNVTLGTKGIAYVELECHGKYWGRGPQVMPIHSSRKAILDSPVWRLVKALSSMVDESGNNILIEGYREAIVPPTDEEKMLVNTLIEKFGDNLFASERENMKVWTNNWTSAEAIQHLLFDTSLNIDGIWAGYTGPGTATILPESAHAKLDSRLVPNQVIAEQIQLIRRHLDTRGYDDITITSLGGGDEWSRTSVKETVVQAVLSVYKHYGIEPAIWPRSPASSPQAQYTRAPIGLPACSGGLGHGGRAHAVDEYIVIDGNDRVSGLVEMEQSFVDILYAFASWPT